MHAGCSPHARAACQRRRRRAAATIHIRSQTINSDSQAIHRPWGAVQGPNRAAALEHFPLNIGNAPESCGTRQDSAARLEQALAAGREAPYGDCCDPGLHGREPAPETGCDANGLSIMVVVRFPASDRSEPTAFTCGWALSMLIAVARRSSDESVSPVMDRILSGCSPNSSRFVMARSTKFRIGTFQCPDHTGDLCKVSFPVTLGRIPVPRAPGLKIFRTQWIGIDFRLSLPVAGTPHSRPRTAKSLRRRD
jgi:hypothetical protein